MLLFVMIAIGIIIFAFRLRANNVAKVAKELRWRAYLGADSLPPKYRNLGTFLHQFQSFEWLMVGEVNGHTLFFVQYITSRLSQFRYEYAIFSFFDPPLSPQGIKEKVALLNLSHNFFVTEQGVFFTHTIPWALRITNVRPIIQKVVDIKNTMASGPAGTPQKYRVLITDMAHYMDKEAETVRDYDTLAEAQAACREIIDRSLKELYSPGMTSEELQKQFITFGEDASCEGFDGKSYREQKIQELCTENI